MPATGTDISQFSMKYCAIYNGRQTRIWCYDHVINCANTSIGLSQFYKKSMQSRTVDIRDFVL